MKAFDENLETDSMRDSQNYAMPQFVNLDALIPREDLEVTSDTPSAPGSSVAPFSIEQLVSGQMLMHSLKKPDFQRETSNWTPQAIVELVKNFLDDELVPAVILWKAPNKDIFVIDGAHRLSALIAWVNNDYGFGGISQVFFKGADKIPKGQIDAAKATEKLVADTIGSYALLKDLVAKGVATPEQARRAKNIAGVAVETQSVRNDAKHAEASFFKINQGGAVISESEIEILRARSRAEAIAARALLRAGTGHEYWSEFAPNIKQEIEGLGKEVYDLLYWPPIDNEWRTLDLPIAGSGYSANAIIVLYELIHIANGITREKPAKGVKLQPLPKDDPQKDTDGQETIKRLKRLRKVSQLIMSREERSLGLHPAVYSYSVTGRFQPSAFFAQVEFFSQLEKESKLIEFTKIRKDFEEFLVTHKYLTNQLVNVKGGLTRSSTHLKDLLHTIYDGLINNRDTASIGADITKNFPKLKIMQIEDLPDPDLNQEKGTKRKGFSRNVKAATRLREALNSAPRCAECGARMHSYGNTVDHKVRKEDGGSSSHSDGAQLMHPFCNSGVKEQRVSMERRASSSRF